MRASNLETMLRLLRDGSVDFGAFVAATRVEYRAMAKHLLRRWPPPEWFSSEDVEQELYIETWHHIWGYPGGARDRSRDRASGGVSLDAMAQLYGKQYDYEQSRGPALSRWVIFGAMCAAKRYLHRARGVTISGSPDKKFSHIETPASFLGEEGAALIETLLAQPAGAELELGRAQETRKAATLALRVCKTPQERYAVLAIREAGSLDGAGRVLYEDVDHRTTLQLENEAEAGDFIEKYAGRVARRISSRDKEFEALFEVVDVEA